MRRLGITLSVMFGAGVTLAGSVGYLPRVGPGTLRFQAPHPVVRAVLPPLLMQDSTPAVAPSTNTTAHTAAEPGPSPHVVDSPDLTATPADPLNTNSTNLPAPIQPGETNGFISPQTFLRFFSPMGRGAVRETVVTPPGFNPAWPGQPTTSSATYYNYITPKP